MSDTQDPPVGDIPPPEPAPPTPLTAEQVDSWLKENNYVAYGANDPILAKLNAPDPEPKLPNPPDYDPYDPDSVARIVKDQTKDLPDKLAATVTEKVMSALNPILNSFAESQISGSVRPEAKPYVDQILKELGFTPFQLAQDPKVAKLVNEAAMGRAVSAKAIPQSILFPADPPGGGGNAPVVGEDAQSLILQSERFLGRALTEEEKKPYLEEFEAAKRKEGL